VGDVADEDETEEEGDAATGRGKEKVVRGACVEEAEIVEAADDPKENDDEETGPAGVEKENEAEEEDAV